MFNIMLKRSHGMHWAKGYIVAMSDILQKKDVAIQLGLKGEEIVHFMSAEAKAMQAAAIAKYDELERQFKSNKPLEAGPIEFDTEPN